MRSLCGEVGVFDLIRRRHLASLREGLVRLILDCGPIPLVARILICAEQARVYSLHQVVVVRPRFYPIGVTLRALNLPINRNLHSSDQLPHSNLHLLVGPSSGGRSSPCPAVAIPRPRPRLTPTTTVVLPDKSLISSSLFLCLSMVPCMSYSASRRHGG